MGLYVCCLPMIRTKSPCSGFDSQVFRFVVDNVAMLFLRFAHFDWHIPLTFEMSVPNLTLVVLDRSSATQSSPPRRRPSSRTTTNTCGRCVAIWSPSIHRRQRPPLQRWPPFHPLCQRPPTTTTSMRPQPKQNPINSFFRLCVLRHLRISTV